MWACMRRVKTGQRSNKLQWKVRTVFAFCLRIAGLAVDVAKGGRILERRSGDPLLDGPAGKRQPDACPRKWECSH